jgi:hypothetical protein
LPFFASFSNTKKVAKNEKKDGKLRPYFFAIFSKMKKVAENGRIKMLRC